MYIRSQTSEDRFCRDMYLPDCLFLQWPVPTPGWCFSGRLGCFQSYSCNPRPHPIVYVTDRSKAIVLVLFLLCVALCFFTTGHFMILALLFLLFCFSSPFSIVIPSLGEDRAGLRASRVFVCLFGRHWGLSFSSYWYRGLAATCDCGPPWTSLLHFNYCFLYIN